MEPIEDLAKQWLQQDRDGQTRSEIEDLLAKNDVPELERRLRERITFGTAGLRSEMKAGFAHMNSLTVLQASQGLADYFVDSPIRQSNRELSIVVGYDARYNSEKFARLAAAIFLMEDIKVLWFGRLVHTPLVPFAVSHFGAAAGVMVTASHNPKNDNGYKVYWSNGCQIIPPHDLGIATAIDKVKDILTWDEMPVDTHSNVLNVFSEVKGAYFEKLKEVAKPLWHSEQLTSWTYTPMHGVGLAFMKDAAHMLGYSDDKIKVVARQAQPDPEFPTVKFPNPEEKGALDLAKQDADMNGTDLILANDPDADRFSVAVRLREGVYQQLTGNQIGILLASHVYETYKGDKTKLAMLASTVSSRMLAFMAAAEGFHFQETLTGFKWLGNASQTLREHGFDPAFAYEEAIGYMFPTVVWDKDGIAAAAVFLTAWQRWKQHGLTPWQKLQELYKSYGYFEDANTYLISPSPAVTRTVFTKIRGPDPNGQPEAVGKRKILRWRDLTVGYDSGTIDHKPILPVDPNAQMITCELEHVVFTVRGSGTEPKIKLYIEAKSSTCQEAQREANEVLADLLRDWFKPEYGLRLAGT